MNQICQILNIEKPILQGPMSWVSTAPLTAAASEAGAFGVLGTAMGTLEFIEDQIHQVKAITNRPFGINIAFHPQFLSQKYFKGILDILIKEQVPAVHLDIMRNNTRTFELDFAQQYFSQWHAAGIKILTKVFTIHDALIAQQAGTDIIIAKGWEGGGHISTQTTMVLVPQIKDAVTVPVIASGGISDGRAMAAAMMLGADGIEMGTVFIPANETAIHPNAKQAVLKAFDLPTTVVGQSADEPCRQLCNSLSQQVETIEKQYPAAEAASLIQPLVSRSGRTAMQLGDIEKGAIMAGQVAPLVKQSCSVKEIIDTTFEQCSNLLQNASHIVLK